jgi:hypothetical protein
LVLPKILVQVGFVVLGAEDDEAEVEADADADGLSFV